MTAATFDVHVSSADPAVTSLLSCVIAVTPSVRLQADVESLDTLLPVLSLVPVDMVVIDCQALHDPAALPAQITRVIGTRAPVIVLERCLRERHGLARLLDAGVAGLMSITELSPGALTSAARIVATGGRYISADLAADLLRESTQQPDTPLTTREHQVVSLIAEGASNSDAARMLGIRLKTVKNHLTSAYAKLDVTSRDQLAGRLDRTTMDGAQSRVA